MAQGQEIGGNRGGEQAEAITAQNGGVLGEKTYIFARSEQTLKRRPSPQDKWCAGASSEKMSLYPTKARKIYFYTGPISIAITL